MSERPLPRMKCGKWKDQKGGGQSNIRQCRRDFPWWDGSIGTTKVPKLVPQLGGGGLYLPKYVTSTEYNSVIRTRTTRILRAWASKVAEAPMQQHPWSRNCLKEGDQYSPKPPRYAFGI